MATPHEVELELKRLGHEQFLDQLMLAELIRWATERD
jgi:hypothetical protein